MDYTKLALERRNIYSITERGSRYGPEARQHSISLFLQYGYSKVLERRDRAGAQSVRNTIESHN